VEEAWPGDIVGLSNRRDDPDRRHVFRKGAAQVRRNPEFRPGGTSAGSGVTSAIGSKHLKKGLAQLAEEGTVQLFRPLLGTRSSSEPLACSSSM